MNANEIMNFLSDFAVVPRSFSFQELSDFADPDIDYEVLQQALLNDKRFVVLDQEASDKRFFVPEKTLFRWFTHLTLRLAQARKARLAARQLANSMSSLRLDGRWDAPPIEAVDFGHKFGFIASAWTPGQYVFPLAWLLSYLSPFGIGVASSTLRSLAEKEDRGTAVRESIEYWTKEGFSQFDERVVYVVHQREGILTDVQATLEEIGVNLGLTRERVRQIEAKFWKKLLECPKRRAPFMTPFMKGFLCEIIRRQGSLIVSAGASLTRFLAKCVGIPQAEVPYTGLVILGALPEDIASTESRVQWSESIDAATGAARLESEGRLCLSDSDLKFVCERVAGFNLQHLTKAQKVYLTLRTIGKPAHYSKVTEKYNRLFPDDPSTEYNIHAVLSREEHGVVWIGARGMFALEEWGYQRPSRTLFDTVTEVVERIYKHTGKPVPFAVIMAETGKYRRLVNPSSLTIAAHCNPNLRRISRDSFIPKDPNDQVQDEISADELDRILQEFQKEVNVGN